MLLFPHLPKTAGTTLRIILYDVYGKDRLFETYNYPGGQAAIDAYNALSPASKSHISVIAGHYGYGLHSLLEEDCRYLTMLREPIERVVSTYFFMRGGNGLAPQPLMEGRKLSLSEFLESGITREVDNGLTRMLCGGRTNPEYGACTVEHLELAKENLSKHFEWVGIVEEFDESVVLLGSKLGWERVPLYRKENVTPGRPRVDEISAREYEVVQKHCNLDAELYNFARDLFHADIAAQPPDFARRLSHYRGHIDDVERILEEEKLSWVKP